MQAFGNSFILEDRHDADLALPVRQNREGIERIDSGSGGVRVRRLTVQTRMLSGRTQRREIVFDPSGVPLAADKGWRGEEVEQELPVAGDTGDTELRQGATRFGCSLGEIRRRNVHDDLREQRIEAGVDAESAVTAGVHAHAGAGGRIEAVQRPAGGPNAAVDRHGLGVDSQLHGKTTWGRDRIRSQTDLFQGAACGDIELCAHQIDSGHLLGDGVLDLQARVGFDECEGGVGLHPLVHQELKRSQAAQLDCAGHSQRRADQALAQRGGQTGRGCDLDQLLPTALETALSFPQMGDLAGAVTYHLDFDMPSSREELFDVDVGVAECLQRF